MFKLDTVQDMKTITTHVLIGGMLPSILGPIFCGEERVSWEMQRIVKAWVYPKYSEVRQIVLPIIEWLIWSCAKGGNEDTRAAETYISVVTLPSQKLKAWQKLWLEGKL